MQRIAILGSTGSIGISALDVARRNPKSFKVVGLSTNANIALLLKQVKEFKPFFCCVKDQAAARKLKLELGSSTKLFTEEDGLTEALADKRIDKVLLAISGIAALKPLLAAIENGSDVALANKEALVAAGPIVMRNAARKKVKIIPVDSEQSAIWQCLNGNDAKAALKNIYLTASGGPFLKTNQAQLKKVSIKDVLAHPRWKMGKKITVDSATLMNKGLEVLEAMFLFNVAPDKIKVLIHPQAIIHSMVEFIDGVTMAQLSVTDMRIPIQYAFSYPGRLKSKLSGVDFYDLKKLTFAKPDFVKFPCLALAYQAAIEQGTSPAVLNAANEIAVEEFLKGKCKFISIPGVIEKVLKRHSNKQNFNLGDVLSADSWAREEARKAMSSIAS